MKALVAILILALAVSLAVIGALLRKSSEREISSANTASASPAATKAAIPKEFADALARLRIDRESKVSDSVFSSHVSNAQMAMRGMSPAVAATPEGKNAVLAMSHYSTISTTLPNIAVAQADANQLRPYDNESSVQARWKYLETLQGIVRDSERSARDHLRLAGIR